MASEKEQKSSPSTSPKREEKRTELKGVEDPKHSSFLAVAKQQAEISLPKDVKDLGTTFSDLFKKGMSLGRAPDKPAIPYYSDLRTNKFAVLSKDGSAVKEDPFNKAVAAFIGDSEEGEVFRFDDPGVKKEAKPLLDDLSHYIHKIKHANINYKVELGDTSRSILFKHVNNYLADLYWKRSLDLTDPLIPKGLLAKYLDKKIQVKKSMTFNHRKLLYGLLLEMNTGDNKDRMANAYCHLIYEAFQSGYDLNPNFFLTNLIKQEKRFTPSLTMLSIKGYIPDCKVSKYKSLFLSTELETIRDSVIELAETRLQELLGKAITADNLPKVLKNLKEIRSKVEDDLLSKEIRAVRRERLIIASRLKEAHKAKTPFKLNTSVSNKLGDSTIRAAFNPFRLSFAQGNIETSPGQAITTVSLNESSGFYHYVQTDYNDKLDGGRVKAIALEFVAYLEG